jgi:predicted RNA binding protein YcfA (HicA-like mRNA interferase family)
MVFSFLRSISKFSWRRYEISCPLSQAKSAFEVLENAGFYIKRRESSHAILRRDDPFAQVVVPDHKEIDRGILRAIIRQAGLSVAEFVKLL